mgnify:CR=1 FL=1
MDIETKEALRMYAMAELSRRNFWQFCLFYDKEFFEKRTFLKDVAIAFQEIEEKKIRALSVSMPPRAGKSYITSLFCAWCLGNNPRESIMRNTCTSSLYLKFSYDVRNIVKQEKFALVFPDFDLAPDKANLQGWNTTSSRQVGYFGAGVGGTIIGFGATMLAITDDLYRGMEDALSDTQNERILQWKEATHDSRLERNCSTIDIGTRWSIHDVIGRNIEQKRYDKTIIIPALDSKGETFCADVMSTQQYLDIRKRINPDIWIAEYMQTPVDSKGRLFKDLKIIDLREFESIRKQIQGAVAYIDVSDQGKDFTAMVVAVITNKDIYIVDYLYTKDNTDVTIPMCASMLKKWKVNYCRVESNAMGAIFARTLQKHTRTRILQVHNTQNKMTRIIMASATINNSFTFLNNETSEYQRFMDNVYAFSQEGKNKNDDAPDCLAGLVIFIRSMFRHLDI